MKTFFLFLSSLCCLPFYFSQAPATFSHQGSSYHVYPYAYPCQPDILLLRSCDLEDEGNKAFIRKYMYGDQTEQGELSEEFSIDYDFEEMMHEWRKDKIKKKMKKVILSNQQFFFNWGTNFNQTITPALETLPDGKYIQFYENYITVDKEGIIQQPAQQPAGFFELKNNLLEGFAYWLSPAGDTIMQGNFAAGARVGEWDFLASIGDYEFWLLFMNNTKNIERPSSHYAVTYVDGLMNGPYKEYTHYYGDSTITIDKTGFYTNDEPSGEWFEYQSNFWLDSTFLHKHYTYADKKTAPVVKQVVIRNNILGNINPYNENYQEFNFSNSYLFNDDDFARLYEVNDKLIDPDEGLELPEEKYTSYEGGEEESMEGAPDMEVFSDEYFDEYEQEVSAAKLRDSLGIRYNYQGVYECFHSNGQLMYRYEFKDGKLLEEDTIFWDNGNPVNVIHFDSVKRQYELSYYDYDGCLMRSNQYDSIGNYVPKSKNDDSTLVIIDGLKARRLDLGLEYYQFEAEDSLLQVAKEKTVMFKTWYKNKKPLADVNFDPQKRQLSVDIYSVNTTHKSNRLYDFGEKYAFVSGKTWHRYQHLRLETVSSGSLREELKSDSVPEKFIKGLNNNYEITDDHTLFFDDKVFNGKVLLNFDAGSTKISMAPNELNFTYGAKSTNIKMYKNADKLLDGQKYRDYDLFDVLELGSNPERAFLAFYPQLQKLIYPGMNEEYGESLNKRKYGQVKKTEGSYINGKPDGKWVSYDFTGKPMVEMDFVQGEIDGEVRTYAWAFPLNQFEEDDFRTKIEDFPTQRIHYLAKIEHFRKGIRQGKMTVYNWKGEPVFDANFVNGDPDGPMMERNKLVTSVVNYEEGLYDGIMQTKLTLPGRDTILLYDLNFQNHQLQGESKAYHTNGKLAKRGFFLNNEPIEDYEAYDTLGKLYHYVKFLYAFPIEEKIWEENELSVKYEFDWRDSIYFRPTDLTDIPSVDRLLFENKLLGENFYDEPYYGRPSLINKNRITYQVSKYYPDEVMAREGTITKGKKSGCWKYYNTEGKKLYEVDYFDTIIRLNDSVRFKSKGIYYDYNNPQGKLASSSWMIEKIENYDCTHTDHYEKRQFYTISCDSTLGPERFNDYVKNYYDNGTLQSEGKMLNGLPTGIWKYYTPNGMLYEVGEYVMGKRNGRWLSGDLTKINYLGDICMNPNAPDIEERIRYQENLIDIRIRYFKLGKIQKSEYYDLNLNKK